jgi:hypothetical protein
MALPAENNTFNFFTAKLAYEIDVAFSFLQVRLLTGVAYSESNLQSKLLYASACFTHGSWTFDRLNGPNLQLFELNFQVRDCAG